MGKYCTKCGEFHIIGEYAWQRGGHNKRPNRASWCRSCKTAYQREHGRRPEVIKRQRRNHLKKAYGITSEEYEALLEEQGGECAICKIDIGAKPYVDHDHVTGKVRGLLCNNCNTGIGLLKDSPKVLERAITYLKAHEYSEV